ncbi:MAG TPA: dihydrofolate reductase [Phycisphaerae bacterium]|nr:dihydrofolate reductase [Phycisphaerae bacterium]
MRINIIAAMTPERLIGVKGKLPWHAPEDLKFFKRTTSGHAVLMGRKTFQTLPGPLPKRRNLILSRTLPTNPPAGTQWFTNLSVAAEEAFKDGETELFVVGGAEIYKLALPLCDRMYLTIVHLAKPVTGDTWFPQWNQDEWELTDKKEIDNLEFLTYSRKD